MGKDEDRTAKAGPVVSRASAHRDLMWVDHLRDAMPRPFTPSRPGAD